MKHGKARLVMLRAGDEDAQRPSTSPPPRTYCSSPSDKKSPENLSGDPPISLLNLSLQLPPPLHRLQHRHLIRIFQIRPHRNPHANPRYPHSHPLQQLRHINPRRLSPRRRIRRPTYPLPPPSLPPP